MKYEKLGSDKGNKKFLYGFITCAVLLILFNIIFSYAKYKVVDSVKLASGTVNYTRADFSLIGIKVQEKNEDGTGKTIEGGLGKDYKDTNKIPEDGDYEFNEENTYCTIGDNIHVTGKTSLLAEGITITYDSNNGLVFSGIKKTNTKCYVYFDVFEKGSSDKTLANLNLSSQGDGADFSGTSCDNGCDKNENGVYQADDDYGTSYYFRGTVDNNWVKFGKTNEDKDIYWRIIRINGNGSIRLIYAGDSDSLEKNPNGKNALGSKVYNSQSSDNKYIGFMYGSADTPTTSYAAAHKNEIESDILNTLYDWWDTTNLNELLNKIDGESGFCNDRQSYNGGNSSSKPDINSKGYGKVETFYGPRIRATQTHQPTLKCAQLSQDLFTLKGQQGKGNGALTKPVGLITADEVVYAGGYFQKENKGYWLYTGAYYWTMSPISFSDNYVRVFYVYTDGFLGTGNVVSTTGVRPVINLKATTKFEPNGNGKVDTPYVVVTE